MCVPNFTSVYLQQVEYFHSKFHTVYTTLLRHERFPNEDTVYVVRRRGIFLFHTT